MKERPNHLVLAGALILVAVVSIFMDLSGLLKSQVLSPPQIISQAKLIPQEQSNGMLAFDIYYQQLS
ncbi:MAG: hypothetical protein U1C97_01010, partial [Candidatus Gracilibacteria bacterium]|nr:hypothetical protein [Candidatus Gracilibacteria bacterium]